MIESVQAQILSGMAKLRFGTGWGATAARGGIWLGAGSGMESGLRFLRNMVLTRILMPEAFSDLALILAVTGAVDAFTEIGIKEAVVQNPQGKSRAFLNGAWWLAFLRGGFLYLIALLLSPAITHFYGKPALQPMLAVALLSILFNGAVSSRAYIAIKEMNYLKWVIIQHGGAIIGIFTTVLLALAFRNVWALVIGFTVESAAKCAISYVVCPYRPGWQFERESLHALLRYTRGVIGLGFLAFLYDRADVFVVGKLCPWSDVGIYTLAYSLVYFPNTLCNAIISPILLSTFSSLQQDPSRLVSGILRVTRILSFIFFPFFALMACCAGWLLTFAYGSTYASAREPFMILCVTSAIRLLGGTLVTLNFATGHPNFNRQASIVRVLVMLVIIVPFVRAWGLSGAAFAALCSSAAWHIYNLVRLRSTIALPLMNYSSSLSAGMIVALMIFSGWSVIR